MGFIYEFEMKAGLSQEVDGDGAWIHQPPDNLATQPLSAQILYTLTVYTQAMR